MYSNLTQNGPGQQRALELKLIAGSFATFFISIIEKNGGEIVCSA